MRCLWAVNKRLEGDGYPEENSCPDSVNRVWILKPFVRAGNYTRIRNFVITENFGRNCFYRIRLAKLLAKKIGRIRKEMVHNELE